MHGSVSAGYEEQPAGPIGFLRAAYAAAWLQYKGLRYHPSNLWLLAAQQWTMVGVWYFVAVFLSPAANGAVRADGGSYVAYVLVGVLVNQVALSALLNPFTTLSEAFWDKRLETYRLARHGIWANLIGRLAWQVLFATCMAVAAAALLFAIGALTVSPSVQWTLAIMVWLFLIVANAGLGLMGASLFFLLEVKNGQDPITWVYQYLVQIVSGLYIPLSVLPGGLKAVGAVLPQTYAFAGMRLIVLMGSGFGAVAPDIWGLAAGAALALSGGILLVAHSLRRAERHAGLGVVV